LEPEAHSILKKIKKNNRIVLLGDISISTQGLPPSRLSRSKTKKNGDWHPYLEKGQVYRYQFIIENKSYVDMGKHSNLTKYYDKVDKLLIRRVINRQDRLMVAKTNQRLVFKKDLNPFVIQDKKYNIDFYLGIMNSKLISYLYVNTSSIATKDDFRQTTLAELRRLPVPIYQESNKRHRRVASLAQIMTELNNLLLTTKSPIEKTAIQRQIDATDKQIDELVYELYGLTADEIKSEMLLSESYSQ
jgi:hypothetical protein